jgi:AraC-like DNA-binding protein/mannose-6-phosphate isomerase-like protein (cupin superfamily)
MSALHEKISSNLNSTFTIGVFQDNLHKSNWHYHDYYEISFITEGTGKRFVADSMDEFQPGDLVFIGRNLPHTWIVDKEQFSPNKRRLEMIYLQFPQEALSQELLALPEFYFVANALNLSERGIRITGETLNKVSEIMLQLPYSGDFERFLLFFKLMDLIGRSRELFPLASKEYTNKRFQSKNLRIQTIHEYLMKNYRKEIDLKQIASLVNMAEGSLCRFFKMQVGTTIFEYLNKIKVEFACKLLMDKHSEIMDVAFDSGFNNLSHFNKQFKLITGVTPRAYRQKFNEFG